MAPVTALCLDPLGIVHSAEVYRVTPHIKRDVAADRTSLDRLHHGVQRFFCVTVSSSCENQHPVLAELLSLCHQRVKRRHLARVFVDAHQRHQGSTKSGFKIRTSRLMKKLSPIRVKAGPAHERCGIHAGWDGRGHVLRTGNHRSRHFQQSAVNLRALECAA